MNGGPYRAPQPSDRRVINRAETSSHRQTDEPQPIVKEETPRATSRLAVAPQTPLPKKESKRSLVWTITLVIFALLVGTFGGYVLATSQAHADTGIDSNKYQAVYLMNGQLYFGKLSMLDANRFTLTNVYYLQAGTSEEATSKGTNSTSSTDTSKFQLIKLTRAIYGPSDEMIISKDQVLYYQNLNADSKASQLIQNDK